jgi:chromosome segregation ATPase
MFDLVVKARIGYYSTRSRFPFHEAKRMVRMKNDFATKADLKKTADGLHHEISAVRTDLKGTEKTLRQEISATREDLHQEIVTIREDLHREIVTVREDLHQEISDVKTELRDRFDGVITAMNGLAGLILNCKTEKASVEHAIRRHEGTLENHETRIGALERKG